MHCIANLNLIRWREVHVAADWCDRCDRTSWLLA